jgi:hypothetical protein
MKYLKLISLFIILSPTVLFGAGQSECKISGTDILYHNANIDTQQEYPYRLDNALRTNQIPGTRVYDCLKAAQKRKWLFVGFGPRITGLDIGDKGVYFDDQFQKPYCKLEKTTFPLKSFEENKKFFEERLKFNSTCLRRRVHHISRYPIRFAPNQANCKVTRINDREYYMDGGICYLMIFPDSQFVFSYEMNEQCLDKNFLVQNNISPMEVRSSTSYSLVSDTSGNSSQFTLLGSRGVHARIDPLESMGDLTDANGLKYPAYFPDYKVQRHEVSGIEITDGGSDTYIKASMLVDNHCKRDICDKESGLCTSRCNYQRPFAAQFELAELKSGRRKPRYLKSWYAGGITPPNWQGAVSTDETILEGTTLKQGGTYQLKIAFSDPKNDFVMLARGRNPLFRTLPGLDNGSSSFATSLINGIPSIDDIDSLDDLPNVNDIADLSTGNTRIDDFTRDIQYLSQNAMWPPYYRDICANGNCISTGRSPWLEYKIQFTIVGIDQDTQKFKLGNVKINQNSRLLGNKSQKFNMAPRVVCPE